jgi:hypothetical protein
MASKTSNISVVDRGTSGGKSYYNTDITTLADGTVQRETYRTDAKGNSRVLIQKTTVNSEGTVTKDEVSSNATVNEQRDLRNPKSQLRQGIKNQVNTAAGELAENNIDGVTKSTLEKAALGSGNAALNEVQTLESLNTAPADTSIVSRDIASATQTRKQFGNSVYPLDLGQTKQDVIKFTMVEYVPQDFNQSGQFGFSNAARNDKGERGIGTVILPIPGGIQDSNSVQWAGQNMNALEAGMANIALNTIEDGGKGLADSTKSILNAIQTNSEGVKTAVGQAFAGAASGTGGQLLTRTTGAVINPNLELLFSGPALRTFSFQFKMNAREAAESREIVKIIRFFKQGSAAQRSASNLFLKTPHTFKIQYLHRGPGDDNDNPFMNKIKECALQSVAVNYTPEGNYATFDDGAMTSYELTLSFQELEPVFNDDYANDNDATIGF